MIAAYVLDNLILKIETITEEQYINDIHNYQTIVDITNYPAQPQVGWKLVNNEFQPSGEQLQPEELIKQQIGASISFGQKMVQDFMVQSIVLSKTYEGQDKTFILMSSLSGVFQTLQFGLLPQALTAWSSVVVTPDMAPFLTEEIVLNYQNRIRVFLGLPVI